MSIHNRTLWATGCVLVLLVGIVAGGTHWIIDRDFLRLEVRESAHHVSRLRTIVRRNQGWIERIASHEAGALEHSDITPERHRSEWSERFDAEAFRNLSLQLAVVYSGAGQRIVARELAPAGSHVRSVPEGTLRAIEAATGVARPRGSAIRLAPSAGIIRTPEGPLMLAISRIRNRNGGPASSMVLGQFIDAREVRDIASTLQLATVLYPVSGPGVPADLRHRWQSLLRDGTVAVPSGDGRTEATYTLFRDLRGKPGFILRFDRWRTLTHRGIETLVYLTVLTLLTSAGCGFFLFLLIKRIALDRLVRLQEAVAQLGAGGSLSARVPIQVSERRRDELDILVLAINGMLASLEEAERRSREAIREQDQLFSGVFHASPDGIAIRRISDGMLLKANASYRALMGVDADELREMTADLPPWGVGTAYPELIRRVKTEDSVIGFEVSFIRKDGERIAVLISAKRILLRGEPCAVLVAKDITVLKRDQALLALRERSLVAFAEVQRRLMEQRSAGVPYDEILSILGGVIRRGAARVYLCDPGAPRHAALQAAWSAAGTPACGGGGPLSLPESWEEMLSRAEAVERRVGGAGEEEDGILRGHGFGALLAYPLVVDRDLRGLLCLVDADPSGAWEPSERRLLKAVADAVSLALEQREARGALLRSEQRYRLLFESGNDIMFVNRILPGDQPGPFIEVNEAACRKLGYPREELLCMTACDIERCERESDRPCSLRAAALHGRSLSETLFRARDGLAVPVEVSRQRFEIDGLPAVLSIARDLTERREAENQLQRLIADLTRSNRDLEQFAYVASHDLQEPLRMVASYVELLSRRYEGRLDEKADRYIHFAVDGAKRMQELINALLAYSRVGTHGREKARMALDDALTGALANLTQSIRDTGAEVVSDALPHVQGDLAQMTQLFQNLIGNALKFRGEAPPRIRITAARERETEGNAPNAWVVSVADNGLGIDPRYAERIFAIFQRLYTRAEYPGTGIGLAVCKRIVERHEGRIWVESRPGEGATFRFTLPCQEGVNA